MRRAEDARGGARPPLRRMIQVSHLTRRFGSMTAVDDLSFEIARGEVVGFLGPNGAGKTTTLRVLCGFLSATGGDVRIAGHDVRTESLAVRRRIGYLPENCPLYPEMRVDEYLRYRAALKGVPAGRVRERVAAVKQQCGLNDAGRRIIGQLSKGYRQRVGMADALVHEPEILILDEPTIGLDPGQIRQTRDLIRALAQRHTILLSTHILPEVEAVCRRILILHRGRLAADGDAGRLCRRQVCVIEIVGAGPGAGEAFAALDGVASATDEDAGDALRVTLCCRDGADPREAAARLAVERGWRLREARLQTQSLEDVFVALTRTAPAPPAGAREGGR